MEGERERGRKEGKEERRMAGGEERAREGGRRSERERAKERITNLRKGEKQSCKGDV